MDTRKRQLQEIKTKYPNYQGVYVLDHNGLPQCAVACYHGRLSPESICDWNQTCKDCERHYCSGEQIRCGSCEHFIFNLCNECVPLWGSWDTIACQTPEDRGWLVEGITWKQERMTYVCSCGQKSSCCWTPSVGIPPCTHNYNGRPLVSKQSTETDAQSQIKIIIN